MEVLEILGRIGFDWQVALANLVNFLIIFYLLKRFAFPKISETLAERKRVIKEGLDNALQAETELQKAEAVYKEKKTEGEQEAHDIIRHARGEEKQIIIDAREKAVEAETRVQEELRAKFEQEQELQRQAFKKDAVELVMKSTEKLLQKEMNSTENERYIQKLTS